MHSDFWVVGICLLLGGVSLWYGLKQLAAAWIMMKTPTSTCDSIHDGPIELNGTVETTGEILRSPISDVECVYYDYKIEEHRRRGKSSGWYTIDSDRGMVPFYLADSTGKACIDPHGAEFHVQRDFGDQSSLFSSPTERFREFLASRNIDENLWLFKRNLRLTEKYVQPGDNLYILGACATSSPYDVPLVSKGSGRIFIISDYPEGSLSWKLWAEATLFSLLGFAVILGPFLLEPLLNIIFTGK